MGVFSVSGTKTQAITQLEDDLGHGRITEALKELIRALPGNQVSLSGNVSATDTQASNMTLSGSSWTT
jgi:hypothetical protein